MTVTSCKLVRGIAGASFGLKSDHQLRLQFLITTDDTIMLPYTVIAQASRGQGTISDGDNDMLPQRYDIYDYSTDNLLGNRNFGSGESNASIYATRIDLTQNTDKLTQWHATVTYGQLKGSDPKAQPEDVEPDPVLRPEIYWFEYGTKTEEITQAYNTQEITGNATRQKDTLGPIVNTAGQDYDEALYRDRKTCTLVIQKNYSTDLTAIALNNTYDATTNVAAMFSGEVYEVAKHCAAFDGATSSKKLYENGTAYYEIQIRIRVGREPFYREIVNRGYKYWDDGNLITAVDDSGDAVSEPALLDSNGTKLASGELGNVVSYRDLEEVSYTALEAMLWP